MADATTAEPVVPGADEAQPVVQPEVPAAVTPEPEQPAAPAEPSPDDNLAWLQSKGIDPSDPQAVSKVAEMYRNAEKTMHESTKKASELEKSLKVDVPPVQTGDADQLAQLTAEVRVLKMTQQVSDFLSGGGNAELAVERKALEPVMAKIVDENPAIKQMVNEGYLTYEQLAAMAKGSDPAHDEEIKSKAGREALEKVADNQQARAIVGAATSSKVTSPVTKANLDSWYAGLSAEERRKPETQAIVSSLS